MFLIDEVTTNQNGEVVSSNNSSSVLTQYDDALRSAAITNNTEQVRLLLDKGSNASAALNEVSNRIFIAVVILSNTWTVRTDLT